MRGERKRLTHGFVEDNPVFRGSKMLGGHEKICGFPGSPRPIQEERNRISLGIEERLKEGESAWTEKESLGPEKVDLFLLSKIRFKTFRSSKA